MEMMLWMSSKVKGKSEGFILFPTPFQLLDSVV